MCQCLRGWLRSFPRESGTWSVMFGSQFSLFVSVFQLKLFRSHMARGWGSGAAVGPAGAIFPVARQCQSCFMPGELMPVADRGLTSQQPERAGKEVCVQTTSTSSDKSDEGGFDDTPGTTRSRENNRCHFKSLPDVKPGALTPVSSLKQGWHKPEKQPRESRCLSSWSLQCLPFRLPGYGINQEIITHGISQEIIARGINLEIIACGINLEVITWTLVIILGFPGGSVVKSPPAMQEIRVWSLGQEDPLEEEMATHSSILAWKIPWTEESGGLQSMGLQRVSD